MFTRTLKFEVLEMFVRTFLFINMAAPSFRWRLLVPFDVRRTFGQERVSLDEWEENRADRHKSRVPSQERRTDGQTDRPTERLIESSARD